MLTFSTFVGETFVKRALVPLPHRHAPVSTCLRAILHSQQHLAWSPACPLQAPPASCVGKRKAESVHRALMGRGGDGAAKEPQGRDLAQVRALEVIAALDAQDMVGEALRSWLNIVSRRVVVETGGVVEVDSGRVVVVETKALKLQAVLSVPLLSSHPSAAAPNRTGRTWSRGIKVVQEGCCQA